jgi:excinuclease ABC subunit A
MTVDEALVFFENHPAVARKPKTLKDVGLGYIKLGQSSTTLSGGEAQRVKLSCELSKRNTGKTCYILDEPVSLGVIDVPKLLSENTVDPKHPYKPIYLTAQKVKDYVS